MDLLNLVKRSRSYRRFYQDKSISMQILREIISLARYTPSARNLQPLKYKAVNTPENCDKIFQTLAWAGYIEDGAPKQGERPSAYIVICNDTTISEQTLWDQGIVAQTMMLGASEKALGGCIIVSINKKEIKKILSLGETIDPVMVLALGHPKEEVVITEVDSVHGVRYYRDQQGVHYVPKRTDNEIL